MVITIDSDFMMNYLLEIILSAPFGYESLLKNCRIIPKEINFLIFLLNTKIKKSKDYL